MAAPDRYVIVERRDGERPRILIELDDREEAEILLQSLRRLHHRVELMRTDPTTGRPTTD